MPNREFTPSSGNVFADLNLPRPDDLLAKAELAAKIMVQKGVPPEGVQQVWPALHAGEQLAALAH